MSEAIAIRPARAARLAPSSLEQRKQYLADAELRARLADAIEAEAAALNQITSSGLATWAVSDGDYRVACELDTATRALAVTVNLPGESIVVLDDRDPAQLIYNRPAGARWPEALIRAHEEAQSLRDVLAAQKAAAEHAKEIKRQSLI
jgi:hypothetical protein